MTPAHPDPHTALRRRLAAAPLPDPGLERISRWRATVAELAAVAELPAPGVTAPGVTAPHPTTPHPTTPHPTTPDPTAAKPPGPGPGSDRAGEDEVRRARARRATWRTSTVAALATVAAIVAFAQLGPLNAQPPVGPPLTLSQDQLLANTPTGRDFGPLTDPATRASCLAGLSAGEPLAGRPVVLDGRPGVLLVLATSEPGRLRLLVVDPGCANVLADTTTGG